MSFLISSLIDYTMLANTAAPRRIACRLRVPVHHTLLHRAYSGPAIKTYSVYTSPAALFVAQTVPALAKYFGMILAGAGAVTYFHPETLITLAPPLGGLAYWAYSRLQTRQYRALVKLAMPEPNAWDDARTVHVPAYVESDVANALAGIDNEYQHFMRKVILELEARIADHVAEHAGDPAYPVATQLVDEGQLVVHLDSTAETFVTTKADVSAEKAEFVDFIRLSVPYFDSKERRTRLGVAEVSLLEVPGSETSEGRLYQLGLRLWPHKLFSKGELVTHSIEKEQ